MSSRPRRILWIVNHRTLAASEVPAIESLGYEVYVPTRAPNGRDYRSAVGGRGQNDGLNLPIAARRLLDTFDFFEEPWTPSIAEVVDRHFDAIVLAFSTYLTPLREATDRFSGPVFLRAFGREAPWRYSDYLRDPGMAWLEPALHRLGARFGFLHAYDTIIEGEDSVLRDRSHRVIAPLPDREFERGRRWQGSESFVAFHCGSILDHPYYFRQYKAFKRTFGHLPHRIFGPQQHVVRDASVLPWLPDDELGELLVRARAFAYTSREIRHLHFSPIEAMLVGTPVFYKRGSLLARMVGPDDPGACDSDEELLVKLQRTIAGDMELAAAVSDRQRDVPQYFRQSEAAHEWRGVLNAFDLSVEDAPPP